MHNESNRTDKAERSGRVPAWSRLIRSVSMLIWSIIGFIILAYGGYYFFVKDLGKDQQLPRAVRFSKERSLPPMYGELDKAVAQALEQARLEARKYAESQLNQWEGELQQRVDSDFLTWYFGYWNTQIRGAKALINGATHWVDSNQPTAQEKLTEEFQKEFTVRVLQPKTSQLQLERIQREALVKFLSHFKKSLDEIPKKYRVAAPDWERYIHDVSEQSSLVEAGRQVPVTLKTVYAASIGGTVMLASKILTSLTGGISEGVAATMAGKMAGKAGAKIAAKTGAKVAGKLGGEFLGPIVGIGIIVWDIWDHYNTVKENKPLLRKSIKRFLDEMKLSILDDPVNGVMAPVYQMEDRLKDSLRASPGKPAVNKPVAE